ncbi:MAG: CAP domain-containing protein [Rubrivivax sp.]|nr:CAP domain-containing protein [Rubrivivax sp.]
MPSARPSASARIAAFVFAAGLALLPAVAGAFDRADAQPLAIDHAGRVLEGVNAYRVSRGLPRLEIAPAIEQVAAQHSRTMARVGRASHDGFRSRFEQLDSDLCVENIATHNRLVAADAVVDGWRRSPAHDRSLLEPRIRWVGIASIDRYTTLLACEGDGRSTQRPRAQLTTTVTP